jgi:protein-S-isoprenylcysteine O-methyltransferase Ste14
MNANTTMSSMWLALRSLLWAVLVPGVIAGYIPWRFFGLDRARVDWSRPVDLLGLLCIVLGIGLLAACIAEFARRGRGTLSPVDPPRHLVVRGLYRYVRNPMYLSVTAIILGEALLMRSWPLAFYWAVFFTCVNIFVIGYEEPALRRQFGASYDEYRQQVGRWIPRLHKATVATLAVCLSLPAGAHATGGQLVNSFESSRADLQRFSPRSG